MGVTCVTADRGARKYGWWCRNRRGWCQQDSPGWVPRQPEGEISPAEEQSLYSRLQALQPVEVLLHCSRCLWTFEHRFGFPDHERAASGDRLHRVQRNEERVLQR